MPSREPSADRARRQRDPTNPAAMSSSAKQARSEAPSHDVFTSSGATGTPVTLENSQKPTLASEVATTATAVVSDQAEITAIATEVSRT
jgi:hypothetical protein